jgi:hypothetical protein
VQTRRTGEHSADKEDGRAQCRQGGRASTVQTRWTGEHSADKENGRAQCQGGQLHKTADKEGGRAHCRQGGQLHKTAYKEDSCTRLQRAAFAPRGGDLSRSQLSGLLPRGHEQLAHVAVARVQQRELRPRAKGGRLAHGRAVHAILVQRRPRRRPRLASSAGLSELPVSVGTSQAAGCSGRLCRLHRLLVRRELVYGHPDTPTPQRGRPLDSAPDTRCVVCSAPAARRQRWTCRRRVRARGRRRCGAGPMRRHAVLGAAGQRQQPHPPACLRRPRSAAAPRPPPARRARAPASSTPRAPSAAPAPAPRRGLLADARGQPSRSSNLLVLLDVPLGQHAGARGGGEGVVRGGPGQRGHVSPPRVEAGCGLQRHRAHHVQHAARHEGQEPSASRVRPPDRATTRRGAPRRPQHARTGLRVST